MSHVICEVRHEELLNLRGEADSSVGPGLVAWNKIGVLASGVIQLLVETATASQEERVAENIQHLPHMLK